MNTFKKIIAFSTLILLATAMFAFTNCKSGDPDSRQKLLSTVTTVLEQQHYSPKKVNDDFSKLLFKTYLNELDADKNLFLMSDVQQFKKFENSLDDEMHGSPIQFFPLVNAIYLKRIPEVITLYKQILSAPFDFNVDETFALEDDKKNYSENEQERKDRWRKKLKYMTLERYVDLLEAKEKYPKDTAVNKPDTALEKEARHRVLRAMDRIYDRIKAKFSDDDRFNLYINTISNLMDPHTDYFAPVEKRAFDEMMSGRFYGIGAQLQETEGVIKIVSLLTGGPAWKSGEILANDVIIKVAQGSEPPVDISGYAVEDAVKIIRGQKGTEVKLTVKRQDGTIKVVSLIRDEIVQDESYARSAVITDNGKKIGYIYLPDFYADFERPNGARCSQDVAKEIIKLKAEGIDGIVLDLRFNGGGSLYEVVQMVGLFINEGPIVQVRDKEGNLSPLEDKNSDVLYDGPLTVMVNEGSASASEIFAAAIQDYKRGIVVGSTSTFGKGTVQKNVPLGKRIDFFTQNSEMGALKLTFQKFYRINGGSTQLKGVVPDVVMPDAYDYLKIREKDNSSSLPWDEIPKASYNAWASKVDLNKVISDEQQAVKANQNFSFIQNNTIWLGQKSTLPVHLKLDKYKEEQKELRMTVLQNQNLTKLKQEMNIDCMAADKDKFYNNPDKNKGDRYLAWLKSLKTDLYINETVQMMKKMIEVK